MLIQAKKVIKKFKEMLKIEDLQAKFLKNSD